MRSGFCRCRVGRTGAGWSLGKVALGPPAAAFGNLQLGERREEPRCRPALFVGAFGKLGPQPGNCRQTEIVQQQRQTGGVNLDRAHDNNPIWGVLSKAS